MSNVLIMGGNGFIGKNICKYFDMHNLDYGIYDLFTTVSSHDTYQGNILTDDNLEDILKSYDTIIYLITSVSPKKSVDFPEQAYIQDVPMLLRVLNYCIENGVTKKVVFASSGGTVYGECNGDSLKEDENIEYPINNYAICKLACEKILLYYNKVYNMNNVILRIGNPYGIGQNPSSGVGVITTFVEKVLNGEEIVLFGDGSVVRDYVDVDTVARAFYNAVFYESKKDVVPVFNVGSGVEINLNDIINLISTTLNIKPKIKKLPERNFDVKRNVLNMEKSSKYLDLESCDMEKEKIKEYIKYLKDNRM